MGKIIEKIIEEIKKEIALLEEWALESRVGGWSTHQIQPQINRAYELKVLLFNLTKKRWKNKQ